MIISHRHKFIFLHNRKCAGTSVTHYLAHYLGPWDILIGSWPRGFLNARALLDCMGPRTAFGLNKYISRDVDKNLKLQNLPLRQLQKIKYRYVLGPNPTHPPAELLSRVFPAEWSAYKKICIIRNPYDRAVSDYFWRCRTQKQTSVSFTEFLKRLNDPNRKDPEGCRPFLISNTPIYTVGGVVACDHLIEFERLQSELFDVLSVVLKGHFNKIKLPRLKANGARRYHYREYYRKSDRMLVEQIYQEEFALHRYRF